MTLDDMMDAADARTLNTTGNAFADRGMWNEAVDCYERSRDAYRQAGDKRGEALALNNLGAAGYAMGDWDAALASYGDALSLLRGLDERESELFTLMNICFLQFAQNGRSPEELDRAQHLAEELGKDEPQAKIYWMRGDAAFSEGTNLPAAFHAYALACMHASRAGGDLLRQSLTYVDEHLRLLVDKEQRLAALAFCDHLLEFGREQSLGESFLREIQNKRSTLLAPTLLGP
jgi:tetratricopeptide (TPR) repeat protein